MAYKRDALLLLHCRASPLLGKGTKIDCHQSLGQGHFFHAKCVCSLWNNFSTPHHTSFTFDCIHGWAEFPGEGLHNINKFPSGVCCGNFFNLLALIFNKSFFIFPHHTSNFGHLFLNRISNAFGCDLSSLHYLS